MKEAIVNYFLEANVAIVISVGLYLLFLRNEYFFGLKRTLLMSILFLSLLIPFIRLENQPFPASGITGLLQAYLLPEITIYGASVPTQVVPVTGENGMASLWHWGLWVYFTGVSTLFLLFIFRLSGLLNLLKSAPVTAYVGRYKIIETDQPIANFSFFHYVYIGQVDKLSHEEKNHIIGHELAHASNYHSADLLFVELLKIVFWFNPVVHLSKNILIALHEFQADQQAVRTKHTDQYCSLLAKYTLATASVRLTNHFNQSLTLKRIAMIKRDKQKMNFWKVAILLPVLAAGFLLVACQDQAMKEVVEKNKTLSQVSDSEIPAELQPQIKQIRQSNPNAKFTYIEGETKEISALAETYKNFKPLAILANPKKGTTGILLQDMSSYAENIKSADDVYMVVEQAASPVGGFSSFMQYLRTNLNYPEAARNANIQGKVFIQFVVQADGSITDTEILKGIGGGCDEEALRVVAASPKWNPGKQKGVAIKQRMSVPIAFNLGNEQGSAKTTNTP